MSKDVDLAEGIEQAPFDEKVDAIATVLDEFPSMQILKAVERLAADPNAGLEAGDVITIAANLLAKEEDKPSAKHESIPRSVEDDANERDEKAKQRIPVWLQTAGWTAIWWMLGFVAGWSV